MARLAAVALVLGVFALMSRVFSAFSLIHSHGPPSAERAVVPGLAMPTGIVRDRFGVPHIEAANWNDALRGLGFAHAQDRLWQMEVLRRSANGRLSELFGSQTLDQDRLARTLGFAKASQLEVDQLPPAARAQLEAYAEGVNAWIARMGEEPSWVPAEMRWLSFDPEPWTVADSLAIVRMRAFLLSRSLGASLLLEKLNRDLGGEAAQDFFPPQPEPPKTPPPPPTTPTVLEASRPSGESSAAPAADPLSPATASDPQPLVPEEPRPMPDPGGAGTPDTTPESDTPSGGGTPASPQSLPEEPPPAAPTPAPPAPVTAPPAPSPAVVGSLHELGRRVDAWARQLGLDGPVGSVGFLVGSARSESGRPLLASDPHVQFRAPALFYFAHLDVADQDLAGGTWPGVPIFWMGHNRRIAWGQVALHTVVTDLFDEVFNPRDPNLYASKGGWTKVEKRVETIEVRWQPSRELDVVETRHGPLLGPLLPDDSTVAGYSLRWAGAQSQSGVASLLELQRAGSWTGFRGALRTLPSPPSTFLYADVEGNMGTQVAGSLPLRSVPPGLLSLPGEYDWNGFIAFDDLPRSFGATLPWRVVSTRGDGSPFPYPTEWLWSEGGASDRLAAELKAKPRISLDEAVALQRERRSDRGVAAVQALLARVEPSSDAARRIAQILREWDGSTDPDSLGVSVYHVFRQQLAARLLEQRLGPDPAFEALAQNAEPLPGLFMARFFDRVNAKAQSDLIDRALGATWTWFGSNVSSNPKRWVWGEIHRVRLTHAFDEMGSGPMRWVGRFLDRGPYPAPGDPDSAWTMYHSRLPAPSVAVGPAARYAVDLADLSHARFSLAGGQSGHPGSPHYDDGMAPWLRGEAWPLWMHRLDVAYHEAGRWELQPSVPEASP